MKKLFTTFTLFIFLCMSERSLAANRYWVAAGASNWNSTLNWSSSSGGTGGSSVPGTTDAVFFDGGSVANCTIDAAVSVASMTVASGYTGTIFQGANTISVAGAASFGAGTFREELPISPLRVPLQI